MVATSKVYQTLPSVHFYGFQQKSQKKIFKDDELVLDVQ